MKVRIINNNNLHIFQLVCFSSGILISDINKGRNEYYQ